MIQRKQPAKRAFSGMVGLTPDLPEDPAPTSAAPLKPVVTIMPQPTPHGGLTGLASQEYRALRDPTTGKVLETTEGSGKHQRVHSSA